MDKYIGCVKKESSTRVHACAIRLSLRMPNETSGVIRVSLRVVSVCSAKDKARLSVEREGSCSDHFPLEENRSGWGCVVGNRKHSGLCIARPY